MNSGNHLAVAVRKKTYQFECDTWLHELKEEVGWVN